MANPFRQFARRLAGSIGRALSYEAVEDEKHRRPRATITQAEDRELTASQRRKLLAQSRDVRRNFELAAWAVRKHLDYVSAFSFRAATESREANAAIAEFISAASQKAAADVSGRHSLRKVLRLAEAHRTVDGDVLLVKMADGSLQMVEGDRIKNPPEASGESETWIHGVEIAPGGRPKRYAVHRRNRQRLEFERFIPANRAYLHAYMDRVDQQRGISPYSAGLNRLRDTYDNLDFALAKTKIAQLLGLVTTRKRMEEDDYDDTPPTDEEEGETCPPGATPEDQLKLDPTAGPFSIFLEEGETATLLQSNQPSNEFQQFMQSAISLCLKSLDIPFFFYDESKLNFFGGKVALSNYLISCRDKREDNADLLNWWTRWRLGTAVATGELDLDAFGLIWPQIDGRWRWMPAGTPWWDKGREITGDILAVHAGFQDYASVVEERTGRQLEDVFADLAEQQKLAAELGLVLAGPRDLLQLAAQIDNSTDRSNNAAD